jgi:hypothetical protein
MEPIYILWLMILCHIIDDFYLQGILAKMKQKKWWSEQVENLDKSIYKYDYVECLCIHGFSWSIMIMLPIIFFTSTPALLVSILIVANAFTHAMIDHKKANELSINLIIDQTTHLWQIIVTWFVLLMI